jgi:hypothetical protein
MFILKKIFFLLLLLFACVSCIHYFLPKMETDLSDKQENLIYFSQEYLLIKDVYLVQIYSQDQTWLNEKYNVELRVKRHDQVGNNIPKGFKGMLQAGIKFKVFKVTRTYSPPSGYEFGQIYIRLLNGQ